MEMGRHEDSKEKRNYTPLEFGGKVCYEFLRIDCAKSASEIEGFIKSKVEALNRKGVVLGLSGGLDSTVVAHLAVRSLGKEKVSALFLPERDTSPESEKDAFLVRDKLGIRLDIKSLTECLKALGCYSTQVSKMLKTKIGTGLPYKLLSETVGINFFLENLKGSNNKLLSQVIAFYRIKHRLRMVTLYQYAELHNLAVLGCANKTERMVGFFVRYGDDSGDILPIVHLYKAQVQQLGEYLGIPERIKEKAPTPDLFPGLTDEELMGIKYEEIDPILCYLEKNMPPQEISKFLSLPLDKIKYVQEMVRFSMHLRETPYLFGK
jgi:NAD+ synthase